VSDARDSVPDSQLRRSYERARSLDFEGQMRECVDQLGNPEVIVEETLEAFRVVEAWAGSRELPPPGEPVELDAVDLEELASEFFYSTREVAVLGGCGAFTSLASNVDPLGDLRPGEKGSRDGLDFVGLTCDEARTPVLGCVQSRSDTSAYPLLLRGLACLAEMAPEAQVARMNRQYFLGALGPRPAFDLDLVLWEGDGREQESLDQLTRDLAEKLKHAIRRHGRFPEILRHIVCLRMNPARFDGRLRLAWRV
jgi:hypothetical protein